jgi:hypothetical protein
MFIYISHKKWVFPPLLWSFPPTAAFKSFPAPACWVCAAPAGPRVCLQLTWEVGLPPILWSFPPSATFTSFPAPGCWAHTPAPTRASPGRPSLFIYSSGKESPPPSSALRASHPLCYVSLLFLLLITQFLFFSQVEVGLSRGLCCSGPELSVGVLHTA